MSQLRVWLTEKHGRARLARYGLVFCAAVVIVVMECVMGSPMVRDLGWGTGLMVLFGTQAFVAFFVWCVSRSEAL